MPGSGPVPGPVPRLLPTIFTELTIRYSTAYREKKSSPRVQSKSANVGSSKKSTGKFSEGKIDVGSSAVGPVSSGRSSTLLAASVFDQQSIPGWS